MNETKINRGLDTVEERKLKNRLKGKFQLQHRKARRWKI